MNESDFKYRAGESQQAGGNSQAQTRSKFVSFFESVMGEGLCFDSGEKGLNFPVPNPLNPEPASATNGNPFEARINSKLLAGVAASDENLSDAAIPAPDPDLGLQERVRPEVSFVPGRPCQSYAQNQLHLVKVGESYH